MRTTTKTTAALHDLFTISYGGLPADPAAIDVDRPRLLRRARAEARHAHAPFDERSIVACNERPLDPRWIVAGGERPYREHLAAATDWLAVDTRGGATPFVVRNAVAGPHLRLYPLHGAATADRPPNLTREARQHALRHGIGETELFHHAVAVLAADPLASAHIPLPDSKELIRFSSLLGYRFASLFAEEPAVLALRKEEQDLRWIGTATRIGKEARMLRGSVLELDEWWATEGKVVVRDYDDAELVALSDHARANAMTTGEVIDLLGPRTCDVYLNDKAYWRNVPLKVWRYAYGDSPLLACWLRDRHRGAIGRALLRDEVLQFTTAARRIAGLLLLGPALARNLEVLG